MSKHENASVFRHKIVHARARFCKQYKQPNRICFHSERNYYNYLLYVHEIAAIIFLFFFVHFYVVVVVEFIRVDKLATIASDEKGQPDNAKNEIETK